MFIGRRLEVKAESKSDRDLALLTASCLKVINQEKIEVHEANERIIDEMARILS